jgi:hypothetical protein
VRQPQLEEMGPIDYVVLEWPKQQPTGEAAPLILDLVDRGIIRILDIAFLVKNEDGSVEALDASEHFAEFEGASSGLLDEGDLAEAAGALEPGTSAACWCGKTVGRPPSPWRSGGPAASSWRAGASRSRAFSPRSMRSRRATDA